MPANYIQGQQNQNLRQRVQFNLKSYWEALHRDSHAADAVRQDSQKANEDLHRVELENSKYVTLSSTKKFRYYVAMVVLLAVYVIDTLLFGGVATMLAKSAFPNNDVMNYVVKIVTPLAFLTVEIYLALLIFEEKRPGVQQASGKKRINPWIIVGVIFALVMPALIISSHPDTVRLVNSSESLATLLSARLVGLTLVAFTVHAVVIFSGGYATEAKAFFLYRGEHKRLTNTIQKLNRAFEQYWQSVLGNYNAYSLELEAYNQQFPQTQISPLNFDGITRDFIRECISGGSEPEQIESVDRPQPAADPDGSVNAGNPHIYDEALDDEDTVVTPRSNNQNSSTEDNSADAENEYLRRILNKNMKDADDEVK